jgi:uroporphyrin-3 C-methyltransferase
VSPENRPSVWRHPASIIAVVALALLGWQWLETRNRLADSEAAAKESRVVARNTQEAEAALQAKVALLETQLAAMQSQQTALDALTKEFARNNDDRLLAEVEQELMLAAQHLRLAGDAQAALMALTDAEARLARANHPQFAPLRQMMARDIERLKALPEVDTPALTQKLETIVAGIDALPLAYERHPKPAEATPPSAESAGFWQSLAADFWQEVSGLVRVERMDAGHAEPVLLSPSQSFFLRENLKLHLGDARLALLTRDGRAFHADLRQADEWLGRYFDSTAKPVQEAQASLRAMQQAKVGAELPALTETLAAARNLKITHSGK